MGLQSRVPPKHSVHVQAPVNDCVTDHHHPVTLSPLALHRVSAVRSRCFEIVLCSLLPIGCTQSIDIRAILDSDRVSTNSTPLALLHALRLRPPETSSRVPQPPNRLCVLQNYQRHHNHYHVEMLMMHRSNTITVIVATVATL